MKKSKQKRILIVRPDRIGDVVLSTPLPREIKKQYPDSYVALLVRNYTMDIFNSNPFVDKIVLLDEHTKTGIIPFFQKVKEIRVLRFTHSLTLLPKERINYLLFFAGIKNRIGVGHKFYQFITNTKSVYRRKYIPLRHEADYCMDTARKIGVKPENLKSEIYLSAEENSVVKKRRVQFLGGKKIIIGVHSTSGNSAPNWKTSAYKLLIDKLMGLPDSVIVITDNEPPKEIDDLAGVLYPNKGAGLRESILNIAALDLLISASTGPMHIAAALNITTISMFCPLPACSPKLWSPTGNKTIIVLPEPEYCDRVCPGDPKKCSFEGRGGIEAGNIFNKVLEVANF